MNRRNIAASLTRVAGALIFSAGMAHNMLGIPELRAAVRDGHISPDFAASMTVEWAFGGLAMNTLGIVAVLTGGGLRRGSRRAWHQAFVIGMLFLLFGLAGWFYRNRSPYFLSFVGLGALVCVPLLVWTAEFRED